MIPLKSNQERMFEKSRSIYGVEANFIPIYRSGRISDFTSEDIRRSIENEKYKPKGAKGLILHLYNLLREAEKSKANAEEVWLVASGGDYFHNVKEVHQLGMSSNVEKGEVVLFLNKRRYYFSKYLPESLSRYFSKLPFAPIKWEWYNVILKFEREKLENNIVEFPSEKIRVRSKNNRRPWQEKHPLPEDISEIEKLVEEFLSEPYQLIGIWKIRDF